MAVPPHVPAVQASRVVQGLPSLQAVPLGAIVWQAPLPLHMPVAPQAVVVAAQRPFGSAAPAATGEQVPTLPPTLQLWQVPAAASVQAVLQQTPSVQLPLAHWVPAEQAAPLGFGPHEPLLQVLGATQSALLVQLFLHVPEPMAALQV